MVRVPLRRALLLAAVASSTCAVALLACSEPYAAIEPAAIDEAGTSGDADASRDAAPPDPCAHAFAPGPPGVDDDPGEELPPFFVAIREVLLTDESKAIVGFDLDAVCTCDPRADTAHAGAPSCAASGPRCDLDGGVDNSVAVLAAQLSPFVSIDTLPQKQIASGRRTVLVQVGKYNGRANDKEIAVGLALSDGIREQGCPGSVEDGRKGIWTPGWCGNDRWSLVPESVIPGTSQPLIQGVGYVRDGVLTISLAGALLLPFNESAVLPLGSAVMKGKLVPLGEDMKPRDPQRAPTDAEKRLWAVENALIGGRVSGHDLLAAVGTIEQPRAGDAGSTYLCRESSFALARAGICDALDITASRALDFDPGASCDALSVGMAFTAYPVLLGDVRVTNPASNPCSPGADGQPPDSGTDKPYSCPTKQ